MAQELLGRVSFTGDPITHDPRALGPGYIFRRALDQDVPCSAILMDVLESPIYIYIYPYRTPSKRSMNIYIPVRYHRYGSIPYQYRTGTGTVPTEASMPLP